MFAVRCLKGAFMFSQRTNRGKRLSRSMQARNEEGTHFIYSVGAAQPNVNAVMPPHAALACDLTRAQHRSRPTEPPFDSA
jgi:hypothetical protein